MRKIYTNIFILFLILQLTESVSDSFTEKSHSKLIGMVRKEVVDKALVYLPKRVDINVLQMLIQLKKAKENFTLNDAESAYLVYKWISQNILENANKGEEDITKVYKYGNGNPSGISSLFNKMCNFLNIESDSISGLLKIYDDDVEHTWNYIVINGEYYLIDVKLGIDMNIIERKLSELLFNKDIFFGTEPEVFIRLHYPKEEKWQLLPESYTLEKFQSMPLLSIYFFMFNLKSVSPDTNKLENSGTIAFNYDESIQITDLTIFSFEENTLERKTDFNISNGIVEVKYNIYKFQKTLGINIKINNFDFSFPIILYKIDNSK